jgi:hypothetical protein
LMQSRKSRRTATTTAATVSSSSLLTPSTSISSRKNSKDTITNNYKHSQRTKISKRFIPWLLFISLTITVALMVYASHELG